MLDHAQYIPGPASGAQVRKGRREVDAHSRQRTAPLAGKSLAGADRSGATARVGALRRRWESGCGWKHGEAHLGGNRRGDRNPVTQADAPEILEFGDIRWELEPLGSGTRLTLWHKIDRRFISWGAAGWHISFDVLDRLLDGTPIGRMAGGDAWQRLTGEYAKQFGLEAPNWQRKADQES